MSKQPSTAPAPTQQGTASLNRPAKGKVTCKGCQVEFPSRNAVFTHLKKTTAACLTGDDYDNYIQFVQSQQRVKTLLLMGYLPSKEGQGKFPHGDDATQLILDTTFADSPKDKKFFNRSYGNQSRGVPVTRQDEGSGALTEVLCVKMAPLLDSKSATVDAWIDGINQKLTEALAEDTAQVRILGRQDMPHHKFNAEMDVSHRRIEYLLPVDMLYHYKAGTTEGATEDAIEEAEDLKTNTSKSRRDFELSFPTFNTCSYTATTDGDDSHKFVRNRPDEKTLTYLHALKRAMQRLCSQVVDLDPTDANAVMDKEFSLKKRKRQQRRKGDDDTYDEKGDKNMEEDDEKADEEEDKSDEEEDKKEEPTADDSPKKKKQKKKKGKPKKKFVLRRKRFHNFTPRVMAHEYLAYRRLDRFYHRGTIVVPRPTEVADAMETEETATVPKTFFRLSLTADLFLHGQVPRVVGLMVALVSGRIPLDMVECLFDENYPHLVPAPPAPSFCLVGGEAGYMMWEGKSKSILSARATKQFLEDGNGGFNEVAVLDRVAAWEQEVQKAMIDGWMKDGVDADTGRLTAERLWTEQVLDPWAAQARKQLVHYREWKSTFRATEATTTTTAVATSDDAPALAVSTDGTSTSSLGQDIDTAVPDAYAKVLQCLREADSSGLWPTTTPKRQLVMVSTRSTDGTTKDSSTEKQHHMSLAMAHVKAKSNQLERSSAYAFEEGQGGASGSFSVGAFPGDQQPKGNEVFPELMKAAFELERALLPDREPSSTIAINRNAQFRPHTDSGAGAGQSRSLIVALGNYSGGELVVEGEQQGIRYNAIEFNGWTQRHWTMPFLGERYSLVWFTPKGCEGVRGIDLGK